MKEGLFCLEAGPHLRCPLSGWPSYKPPFRSRHTVRDGVAFATGRIRQNFASISTGFSPYENGHPLHSVSVATLIFGSVPVKCCSQSHLLAAPKAFCGPSCLIQVRNRHWLSVLALSRIL